MTKKWLNETINSEVPLTQSDSSHMTSDDYYPTSSRHFYFSVFLILSCIWNVRKPWEAGEKKYPLINSRQVLNLKIMCKGKFCVFFLLISFLIIFVVVILISATRGLTWVIMHFTPLVAKTVITTQKWTRPKNKCFQVEQKIKIILDFSNQELIN